MLLNRRLLRIIRRVHRRIGDNSTEGAQINYSSGAIHRENDPNRKRSRRNGSVRVLRWAPSAADARCQRLMDWKPYGDGAVSTLSNCLNPVISRVGISQALFGTAAMRAEFNLRPCGAQAPTDHVLGCCDSLARSFVRAVVRSIVLLRGAS